MVKVTLTDIVNLPAFEEAADLFYRATKMTVSFPDHEGNIVFYPGRERCAFCHMIQSTERGRELCRKSDEMAADIAFSERRPMFYTCHAGLIDVVVPIVVDEERIGCFYSGQSLLSTPTRIGFQDVLSRVGELGLDQEELWEAYRKVRRADAYKIEMAVELLSIICNNLIQGQIELAHQRKMTRTAVQKARLERDLREMELRLSQAQLNPHFLFNSLNLILGEALNENAQHTAHLVEELSVLLSNVLTNIGSMVTLDAEVASAKAYVDIYRARFETKIDLEVDVPGSLINVKVPALILQPLVENALVHGFSDRLGNFRIAITASDSSGFIDIKVSDNGCGMDAKKLAVVSRQVNSRAHTGKLTGLRGLNRRLKYYYSQIPKLHLEQCENGFSVTIRLPLKKERSSIQKPQ